VVNAQAGSNSRKAKKDCSFCPSLGSHCIQVGDCTRFKLHISIPPFLQVHHDKCQASITCEFCSALCTSVCIPFRELHSTPLITWTACHQVGQPSEFWLVSRRVPQTIPTRRAKVRTCIHIVHIRTESGKHSLEFKEAVRVRIGAAMLRWGASHVWRQLGYEIC
jgi:hypothetical protein